MAEPVGAWLKRMRGEKGLTQELLGERIGVKHTTIQRYEAGSRKVNFDVLLQLADALPVARTVAIAVWIAANIGDVVLEDNDDTGDLVRLKPGDRFVIEGTTGDEPPLKMIVSSKLRTLLEAATALADTSPSESEIAA